MIGKASYDKGLEAMDHIEKALVLYKEVLGNCYLLCEDGIEVEEHSLYAETIYGVIQATCCCY